MIRYILHFICLLAFIPIYSQADFRPGYIIGLDNDTVYGQINYRGELYHVKHCMFRTTEDTEAVIYSPTDIQAYRFENSRYYLSREIELDGKIQSVFIELLVDGMVDLYFLAPQHYYIQAPGKELTLLENTERTYQHEKYEDDYRSYNKEYIATLKLSMQDCPQIWSRIDNSNLEQSSLIKITTGYHDLMCPDEKCLVYHKSEKIFHPRLGISVGTDVHLTEIHQGAYLRAKTNFTGLTVGISLDGKFVGKSERFYPSMNLGFSRVYYQGDEELDYSIKNNSFYVDASVNYIYPKYRIQPYLGIGGKWHQTYNHSEAYIVEESYPYTPLRRFFGVMADFGILYEWSEDLTCKIQADYFKPIYTEYADGIYDVYTEIVRFSLSMLYSF